MEFACPWQVRKTYTGKVHGASPYPCKRNARCCAFFTWYGTFCTGKQDDLVISLQLACIGCSTFFQVRGLHTYAHTDTLTLSFTWCFFPGPQVPLLPNARLHSGRCGATSAACTQRAQRVLFIGLDDDGRVINQLAGILAVHENGRCAQIRIEDVSRTHKSRVRVGNEFVNVKGRVGRS